MTFTVSAIFIHIGVPKTGSTYLQRFFHDNRDELRRRGICYPEVSLRGWGHHDLAYLSGGGYPDWATPQERSLDDLTRELRDEVRAHSGPILLSSENFYLMNRPEAVMSLLEDAEVAPRKPIIIVYLRRQDAAHESWYNQMVKAQGASISFEESLRRYDPLWDYEARLSEWAGLFGEDNLIVHRYPGGADETHALLEDISAIIGFELEGLTRPESQVNSRLNRDLLEFQRLVNRLPLTAQEKRKFHRELIELTERTAGDGLFEDTPLLSGNQRQAIMKRYTGGNKAVATRYFGGEALFDPVEDWSRPERWSGLSVEKLTYMVGWLMATRDRQAE